MFFQTQKVMPAMSIRLLPFLLLAGCALRDPGDFQDSATEDATTTAGPAGTSAEPETTGGGGTLPGTFTATTPAEPTTGVGPTSGVPDPTATVTGSDTTSPFIVEVDQPGGTECDLWTEDCPEGQKCMPYANDGGSAWNATKCVPIVRDPDQFGEPCQAIGSGVSGEDTCDKHLMCWDLDLDTLQGTCTAMCIGSPDAPDCEAPNTTCALSGDGVLILCIPNCDPLKQDCPAGDACISSPYAGDFVCVLDVSGEEGQVFDPCDYANACDPGLNCLDATLADECDPQGGVGCCLPFCDTSLANTCPGQGLECVPWFEEGFAPPGLENVGICALPQ
ncbi:ribulose phosphate epimerase [Nannocystis sp. SCPEA4]|uniref:ribulose phosphate epimerase n=1 Tax=Nannocystis sp. SCPEA4 TaxID=2996787 RepID=UPI00226D8F38|nr:ribulose phosphate epimerase [Nannocystis sp. SCPEA4]MCY1060929.1 ribulose phosphate epimerase [Nannocystis sp. SCPEA4]